MPDTHPVNSHAQAATNADTLSPSSTLSSDGSSLLSSSSSKPQHRRFLSLDGLEATSTKILTHIRSRSRSPLPQESSPMANEQPGRSPSPCGSPSSTAPQPPSSSPPPSPSSVDQSYSPSAASPTSSHHPQRPNMGHSRDSDDSATAESSGGTRSSSHKRYSGTLNHYGRHSNDWLFNGFSVRDTLRDGIEKLKGSSEKDS
jgi:hypothetical protein